MKKKPLIAIVMGSDSDYPIMEPATKFLDSIGIPYELKVSSAHRTPDQTVRYAKSAKKRGLLTIIAAAGGAAHLPGVIAALTSLPVIGVPIKTKNFEGIDSLLSIMEMPKGVPVATVGVNNSENAAILATRIIALTSSEINKKLEKFKREQVQTVLQKDRQLQQLRKKKK